MTLPAFSIQEPGSLADVCRLLETHGEAAAVLAGGTDLVVALKQRLHQPQHLISLARVEGLDQIAATGEGLRIGAMVTLDRVATDAAIRQSYPGLAEAAAAVGSPLQRTAGTLGGNLCLDTRCRYFNQSEFWRTSNTPCFKAGGTLCHVTNKEGHCSAAYSGDVAPALLALDARVVLATAGGEQRLPLADFYTGDGKYPTLASREPMVLAAVELPAGSAGGVSFYRKFRSRGSIEFPLAGVAGWLQMDGGVCQAARLYATGVEQRPVALEAAGALLAGQRVETATLAAVAAAASRAVSPVKTTTVGPAYRRTMVGLLLAQALAPVFGLSADALLEVEQA